MDDIQTKRKLYLLLGCSLRETFKCSKISYRIPKTSSIHHIFVAIENSKISFKTKNREEGRQIFSATLSRNGLENWLKISVNDSNDILLLVNPVATRYFASSCLFFFFRLIDRYICLQNFSHHVIAVTLYRRHHDFVNQCFFFPLEQTVLVYLDNGMHWSQIRLAGRLGRKLTTNVDKFCLKFLFLKDRLLA